MQIKWTDSDPETGQRRFLCAERFAGVWRFKWKLQRRGDWTKGPSQTLAKIGFKGLTVKPGDKIAIPGFRAQVGNSVPSAWNEIAASLFLLSCPVGHL